MIYRSDKDIEKIKQTDKTQRIRIATNLYLNVSQNNRPMTKKWYIRAKHNGKTKYEYIGMFDLKHKSDEKHISLNEAKDILVKKFDKIDREARIEKMKSEEGNPLFCQMCEEWLNSYEKNFRTSTFVNTKKIVHKYITTAPFYFKKLSDIKKKEIRNLVVNMPKASASKCLTYVRHIFKFAEKHGFYVVPDYYYGRKADSEVPLAKDIDISYKSENNFSAIIKPTDFGIMIKKIKEHKEKATLMSSLYITTRAILFLAYNFCRGHEMLSIQWQDIDLDFDDIIILPATKIKHNAVLKIPFAKQTKELLLDIRRYRIANEGKEPEQNDYVFHARNNTKKQITSEGLSKFMRKIGYGNTIHCLHGFRSTASTMLRQELHYSSDYIELQLGHTLGTKVINAYNRSEMLPERKKMLQDYADYIDTLVADLDKPYSERFKHILSEIDPSRMIRINNLTGEKTIITRDELLKEQQNN